MMRHMQQPRVLRRMIAYCMVHYDSTRQLVLACDAFQYGLGAVLSHIMDDGQEHPVAYASRTLTPAEKNYSQLEKEALGVVFAVKKFTTTCLGDTS